MSPLFPASVEPVETVEAPEPDPPPPSDPPGGGVSVPFPVEGSDPSFPFFSSVEPEAPLTPLAELKPPKGEGLKPEPPIPEQAERQRLRIISFEIVLNIFASSVDRTWP